MCWALGCGFVLARPESESPALLELDEDPAAPLELFELPEPELPQAATTTAHTDIAASRSAAVVLRVIFSIVHNLPRTCRQAMPPGADPIRGRSDRPEPRSLFPIAGVSAGAITSR
jgi:hypothetical protein